MEVDHAVFAGLRLVELEGAHSAEAAHEGVSDHLREGGGDRRIEGGAALRQDFDADIGGARLRTDDNAFHGTLLVLVSA